MAKDLRCVVCGSEFTTEEVRSLSHCPRCNTTRAPVRIEEDD